MEQVKLADINSFDMWMEETYTRDERAQIYGGYQDYMRGCNDTILFIRNRLRWELELAFGFGFFDWAED